MDENNSPDGGAKAPNDQTLITSLGPARNPFATGFKPTGNKPRQKGFGTKRALLRHMLEVDIRIGDLPVYMADKLRAEFPGLFENVTRKFTMAQIMELTQLQLLFSRSDLVRQHAINAIKDRTEGKPVQKVQLEAGDEEPTRLKLANGFEIDI